MNSCACACFPVMVWALVLLLAFLSVCMDSCGSACVSQCLLDSCACACVSQCALVLGLLFPSVGIGSCAWILSVCMDSCMCLRFAVFVWILVLVLVS